LAQEILKLQGIYKTYSNGVKALVNVDLDVMQGEIHGLLGENGAGKTTLMKVIYGIANKDKGKIFIMGKEVEIRNPRDAIRNGIGMVPQHFMLIRDFTVAENLVLFSDSPILEPKWRSIKKVKEFIKEMKSFNINPDALIENLSLGEQQRVEILKVLLRGASIILLDEPTSVLSPLEIRELFKILRELKENGKSIIFITHKIEEVMEICDRVTVLRRGLKVGTVKVKEINQELLAEMMVGSKVSKGVTKGRDPGNKIILEVRDLRVKGRDGVWRVRGLNLKVREGEIYGIAGVEGNGQLELAQAISGILPYEGEVIVKGKDLMECLKNGECRIAYIPDDRKYGLVLDFDIRENCILGIQRDMRKGILLDYKRITNVARSIMEKFKVYARNERVQVKALSGGNQQKVIIGREFFKDPDIIVAYQPTHGLDIASTQAVHDLLIEKRNEGKSIVLISSDINEVFKLSDRVGFISSGRIIGEGLPQEFTLEKVGLLLGGGISG